MPIPASPQHINLQGIDGRIAEEVEEIKAMEEKQENVPPQSSAGGFVCVLTVVARKDCGVREGCGDCSFGIEPGTRLMLISGVFVFAVLILAMQDKIVSRIELLCPTFLLSPNLCILNVSTLLLGGIWSAYWDSYVNMELKCGLDSSHM